MGEVLSFTIPTLTDIFLAVFFYAICPLVIASGISPLIFLKINTGKSKINKDLILFAFNSLIVFFGVIIPNLGPIRMDELHVLFLLLLLLILANIVILLIFKLLERLIPFAKGRMILFFIFVVVYIFFFPRDFRSSTSEQNTICDCAGTTYNGACYGVLYSCRNVSDIEYCGFENCDYFKAVN